MRFVAPDDVEAGRDLGTGPRGPPRPGARLGREIPPPAPEGRAESAAEGLQRYRRLLRVCRGMGLPRPPHPHLRARHGSLHRYVRCLPQGHGQDDTPLAPGPASAPLRRPPLANATISAPSSLPPPFTFIENMPPYATLQSPPGLAACPPSHTSSPLPSILPPPHPCPCIILLPSTPCLSDSSPQVFVGALICCFGGTQMTAFLLGQPAGWLGSLTSPAAYATGFWSQSPCTLPTYPPSPPLCIATFP